MGSRLESWAPSRALPNHPPLVAQHHPIDHGSLDTQRTLDSTVATHVVLQAQDPGFDSPES